MIFPPWRPSPRPWARPDRPSAPRPAAAVSRLWRQTRAVLADWRRRPLGRRRRACRRAELGVEGLRSARADLEPADSAKAAAERRIGQARLATAPAGLAAPSETGRAARPRTQWERPAQRGSSTPRAQGGVGKQRAVAAHSASRASAKATPRRWWSCPPTAGWTTLPPARALRTGRPLLAAQSPPRSGRSPRRAPFLRARCRSPATADASF